jgi:hypothetical protein
MVVIQEAVMRTMAMSLLAAALVAAGTTMRAAPDQTARPGDMTEARLWIQNRTRADAIAVNLRAADIETPLRVQVANTDSNPHSVKVSGSIRTQPLRQEWDYETVVIVPDANPLQALKQLGLAGWETTGVSWPSGQGTPTLLLKRPR